MDIVGKIEEVLEEYASTRERIVKEYGERAKALEWEEAQELLAERDERLGELEEEVVKKLEEVIGERGKVLWECVDSHEYASGMGFSHTAITLIVCDLWTDKPGTALRVWAQFRRSAVYGRYEYVLEDVWTEEVPIVDDEHTPFTAKLLEEIPWQYIRPIWARNIEKMIAELARAEWEGRLREKLGETVRELEGGAWIYDYQHVLAAVYRAAEALGIQV
ncbi:MAG: hypothetical protein DRJ67_04140 [Thermoprotei archaeon]|nr:MAG: hypothetical protein DRJ67_04140 [Thermoprotei archaeon]